MSAETANRQDTVSREEFEALRLEFEALRTQIAGLHAEVAKKADSISEETLMVISAAVAAYLGKRATIKFVRLAPTDPDVWRAQGRAALQASHQMPRTRAW